MAAAKVTATTSFVATVGDVEHFVHEGEELPTTHPVVKAQRDLFDPPARKRSKT